MLFIIGKSSLLLVIKVPKEELDKSLNLVECRVEKIGYFYFKETILFPTSPAAPCTSFSSTILLSYRPYSL